MPRHRGPRRSARTRWAVARTALAAAIFVLAGLAGPALAVDPGDPTDPTDPTEPSLEGVVFDGSLTVDVVDETGLAQAATDVVAEAFLEGGESIWGDGQPTDADGRVTFTGLPRPEPGGPAITWQAELGDAGGAFVDGCWFFTWTTGVVEVAASATPVETVLVGRRERAPSGCDDPAPGSPLLTGLVVDEAGIPVPGSTFFFPDPPPGAVSISQTRGDGGVWSGSTTAAEDGTFSRSVHAWGTADEPSPIVVSVVGPHTRTVTDEQGCIADYALVGSATVEVRLAEDPNLEPVRVALSEGLVQAVCSETEVPGEGATDGGDIELPATDAAPARARLASTPAAALAILATALGLLAVLRRRRDMAPEA